MSTLSEVNKHLFAALERLSDTSQMTEKEIKQALDKSKVITQVAGQIVNSAKIQLEGDKYYNPNPISPGFKEPKVFKLENKDV